MALVVLDRKAVGEGLYHWPSVAGSIDDDDPPGLTTLGGQTFQQIGQFAGSVQCWHQDGNISCGEGTFRAAAIF
jgi:hypothetical protein